MNLNKYPLLLLITVCSLGCENRTQVSINNSKAVSEPSSIVIESDGQTALVKSVFKIYNQGETPFEILKVSTSCGCTDLTFNPKIVSPGDFSTLTANISSIEVGTKIISLEVVTNIPEQPILPISVKLIGVARPPYVVNRTTDISFGQFKGLGKQVPVFVETHELINSPLWIKSLKSPSEYVSFKGGLVSEIALDGKSVKRRYQYDAVIEKPVAIGEFKGEAILEMSQAGKANTISISFHGFSLPTLLVSPSAIYGSFEKVTDIPIFKIVFRAADPEVRLKIEHTSQNKNRLLVVKTEDKPGLVTFNVRLEGSFHDELVDEILFSTGLSDLPIVRVPVRLQLQH